VTLPFRILGREVLPDLNRIVGPDRTVSVEPKVMGVLVRLARTPGEVVSRRDLNREVWGGAYVSDDALTRTVAEIRRAFGDDAREPRVVETIARSGYRLVAPVEPAPGSSPPRRAVAAPGVAILAVAAAGGALAFMGGADRSPPAASPTRAISLTLGAENEFQAALSPDGRSVAFVRSAGGNDDLYLRLVNDETALRLTDHPAQDHHPVWSPDGTRIAFVREGPEECEVLVMSALGGDERHVVRCGLDQHGVAWTADGRELVLPHREGDAPWRLRRVSLDGSRTADLPPPPSDRLGDHSPAISPDGEWLAFVRSYAPHSGDVYLRFLEGGGEARRLTFDDRSIAGLDWWHDGGSLVVSSDRAGSYGLWRVPVSGSGEPQWLAGGALKLKHPSAARLRPALVYEAWNYEKNVWGLELEEGAAPRRLAASTQWDMHPGLSPDGARVAFVSTRSGHPEVWVAGFGTRDDTAPPSRLTSLEGPDVGQLCWSPDGTRVVFEARPHGAADLFVAEVPPGAVHRLTALPGDEVAPSWSRDGRLVYFGSRRSDRWEVWAVPAAGGEPQRVTFGGGLRARESSDGRSLYYAKSSEPGLFRRERGGEEERRIWPGLPLDGWASWDVARGGVIVVEPGDGGAARVVRLGPDGRAIPVASLGPGFVGPGVSVSPDGRRLAYTRADRAEARVMLLELR
jgi:Tol biopolymer transport system component/DNA-binding winged helix-turn-helix (wHTH) protein